MCKYFCEGLRLCIVVDNVLNLIVGLKVYELVLEIFFKYSIFGKRVLSKVTSCLSHFIKSHFRNGSDKRDVAHGSSMF